MLKREGFNRVYELLGRPKHGKFLRGDGDHARYGEDEPIARADFVGHCFDEGCLAVGCVDKAGRALFIAFDIDRGFNRRLPVFQEALEARGLADAALIVSGSGVGRGKIILTLAAPITQTQAIEMVASIFADIAKHPMFGDFEAHDITLFPQNGQGGHVRVFGRNRKRRGHGLVEAILDWNGDLLWSLDSIRPAVIKPEVQSASNVPIVSRKLTPYHRLPAKVRHLIEERYTGRGADVKNDMMKLASAAIRHSGDAAEATLTLWVAQIVRNSPDMRPGALKQLGEPGEFIKRVLGYVRKSAPYTPKRLLTWIPVGVDTINNPNIMVLPDRGRLAYAALAEYVIQNALDPYCLGMTYSRIADLAPDLLDKRAAQRAINDAEASGLLYRLDRGQPVKGGLCTLFTLVGVGDTIDAAIARGIETDAFQKRIADRDKLGLGLPTCMISNTTLAARAAA